MQIDPPSTGNDWGVSIRKDLFDLGLDCHNIRRSNAFRVCFLSGAFSGVKTWVILFVARKSVSRKYSIEPGNTLNLCLFL